MRKKSDQFKLWDNLQNNWPVLFKMSMSTKEKKYESRKAF